MKEEVNSYSPANTNFNKTLVFLSVLSALVVNFSYPIIQCRAKKIRPETGADLLLTQNDLLHFNDHSIEGAIVHNILNVGVAFSSRLFRL